MGTLKRPTNYHAAMPADRAHDIESSDLGAKPARFHDRVLALAASAYEQLDTGSPDQPQADATARRAGGDLERRIITRAKSLGITPSLESALHQVRSAMTLVTLTGLVLAVVAGAGVARAALASPRDEPVNFFWALGAVLGVQTLTLMVWFALMLFGRHGAAHGVSVASLGGLFMRLAQFITSRMHKGPRHAAAVAAVASTFVNNRVGKWTLSAISHGVWLAFNVGCLSLMILLLSSRTYTFTWETTILSPNQYVPLTRAISALPDAVGFLTPTREQIAQSERTGESISSQSPQLMSARQEWSSLLIGALVMYGFAPRLLLLALCLGQRRHALARYRLDTSRPEFIRLMPRLMPVAESIGVTDVDDGVPPPAKPLLAAASTTRPIGPPAILGFELPQRSGMKSWPPALHQVRWLDLEMVDSRDDQRRVLTRLSHSPEEPSAVVVVCALTTTPDRGVGNFLREVQGVLSRPIVLALTAGHALRQRTEANHVQSRIQDWRRLAAEAGVPAHQVVDIDLDHLTDLSAAQLAAIIHQRETGSENPAGRRIEPAFGVIEQEARRWFGAKQPPTASQRAELHRQIALLYRADPSRWRDLLATPVSLEDVADRMKSSANRMMELLPQRLRLRPKWIAAGAAAGALGCVTAATLISPVAIAALPMWSAIGAGVSALLSPHDRKSDQTAATDFDAAAVHEEIALAVRAAALFALLLELQSRGDAAITRIFDRVLDTDAEIAMSDSEAAATWLDAIRHRLDLALAAEAAR